MMTPETHELTATTGAGEQAHATVQADAGLRPDPGKSSVLERAFEYGLLAELARTMLVRGMALEVLRVDADLYGYDIVLEAGGVMRHVQLKAMAATGARADITVNTALAQKPSGCVIWMLYNPLTLRTQAWRWLGGAPGQPLPPLGDIIPAHSRANAQGIKQARPLHRVVRRTAFDKIASIGALATRLFGPPPADDTRILLDHLAQCPQQTRPAWLEAVRRGAFSAIPAGLRWEDSGDLAHLIDGYTLIEELGAGPYLDFLEAREAEATATGTWKGTPLELWILLFLEHRRWRMSSPYGPWEEVVVLLDRLCQQLRDGLAAPAAGAGERDR